MIFVFAAENNFSISAFAGNFSARFHVGASPGQTAFKSHHAKFIVAESDDLGAAPVVFIFALVFVVLTSRRGIKECQFFILLFRSKECGREEQWKKCKPFHGRGFYMSGLKLQASRKNKSAVEIAVASGKRIPFNWPVNILILFLVAAFSFFASAQENTPSLREQKINQAAESLRPTLIEIRRDIHMHPELSNREERTERVIAEKLKALGLTEIKTNVAKHGVVALLKGNKPGPVVAVRADIDALPISEAVDVPYKSQNTNVMHACGHDVHTTVELGVAEVLSKMREEISGTIKFIFQPAEEGPPVGEEGGAPLMIKEGVLENPKPLAIFGLHTTTEIETGKIGVRAGGTQAAADMFDLTIRGKMSHAAKPQAGIDSIVIAAECISALQTIKSRRIDTFEPVILTIGTIHGGNRRNIISPEVKLEGTIRTLSEETRKKIKELMKQTLDGVCSAYGATYDLKIDEATCVVFNDPKLVEETTPVMRRALGEKNVIPAKLRMGAEDFSYFQRVIPGFYFRLGSGNSAKGITAEAHTPLFNVDVECLVVMLGERASEFTHGRTGLEQWLGNRIHQVADGHALECLMRFGTQLPKIDGPSVQRFRQGIAQRGECLGDLCEHVSPHHQHLHRRSRPDAEMNGLAAQQSVHAEKRLRPEDVHDFGSLPCGVNDFHFAAFNDVEAGGLFPLSKDQVARLVMGVRDPIRLARAQVGKVARKQELPAPVESNLEPPGP